MGVPIMAKVVSIPTSHDASSGLVWRVSMKYFCAKVWNGKIPA